MQFLAASPSKLSPMSSEISCQVRPSGGILVDDVLDGEAHVVGERRPVRRELTGVVGQLADLHRLHLVLRRGGAADGRDEEGRYGEAVAARPDSVFPNLMSVLLLSCSGPKSMLSSDPVALLQLLRRDIGGVHHRVCFAETEHHHPVGHLQGLRGVLLGEHDGDPSGLDASP